VFESGEGEEKIKYAEKSTESGQNNKVVQKRPGIRRLSGSISVKNSR